MLKDIYMLFLKADVMNCNLFAPKEVDGCKRAFLRLSTSPIF